VESERNRRDLVLHGKQAVIRGDRRLELGGIGHAPDIVPAQRDVEVLHLADGQRLCLHIVGVVCGIGHDLGQRVEAAPIVGLEDRGGLTEQLIVAIGLICSDVHHCQAPVASR
jgi:hypothetical protein